MMTVVFDRIGAVVVSEAGTVVSLPPPPPPLLAPPDQILCNMLVNTDGAQVQILQAPPRIRREEKGRGEEGQPAPQELDLLSR